LKIRVRAAVLSLAALLIVASAASMAAQENAEAAKKKVASANDLPRFSYPIERPPSVLITSDDATFNPFAKKVLRDVNSVLNDYDIDDKATLRQLYATRLNIEVLTNDNQAALETSKKLRDLQEKPQAQATSGMLDRPLIEARLASHDSTGEAFLQAFREKFQQNLNALEWKLVQDRVKGMKGNFEIVTPDLIEGGEKQDLDPLTWPVRR
jgi:hypothetical protein